MQNKAIFYFHYDIFIFENKVVGVGGLMQLDGQFDRYPAAVEFSVSLKIVNKNDLHGFFQLY